VSLHGAALRETKPVRQFELVQAGDGHPLKIKHQNCQNLPNNLSSSETIPDLQSLLTFIVPPRTKHKNRTVNPLRPIQPPPLTPFLRSEYHPAFPAQNC
jgi:hypothetical protein